MLCTDRDALTCDLAETYGIYDYRGLPARTLAALAVGLRDDSRIKMKLAGMRISRTEMLLAAAVDRLSLLIWIQTEDGRKGVNRPKSVLNALMGEEPEKDGAVMAFTSASEFEAEWARITGVSHE